MRATINTDGTIKMWAILGVSDEGNPRIIGLMEEEKKAWQFVIKNLEIKKAAVQKIELDTNTVEVVEGEEEMVECGKCEGTGIFDKATRDHDQLDCDDCQGSGEVRV